MGLASASAGPISLAILLMACGGSESDSDPNFEGGPDHGPITVTFAVGDEGVADLRLIFHDPEGEVTGEAVTDEVGAATHTIDRGAMVTIVGSDRLITVVGIAPGELSVRWLPGRDTQGDRFVEIGAPSDVPTATRYRISVGCLSPDYVTELPAVTPLADECLDKDGRFSVQLDAIDEQNHPLATSFMNAVVAPDPGQTSAVAMPDWNDTLDEVFVNFDSRVMPSLTWVNPFRQSMPFMGDNYNVADISGSSLVLNYHRDVGDLFHLRTNARWENGTVGGTYGVQAPSLPDALQVDQSLFGAPVGRPRHDVSEPARPRITLVGDTSAADGIRLQSGFQTNGIGYGWTVALPPETTEFRFPSLPESVPGRPVTQTEWNFEQRGIVRFEASFLEGYRDFLDQVFLSYDAYFYPRTGEYDFRSIWALFE